jgi:heme exporter protein D
MNLEFFLFNGFGQFIWPAFIFTFLSCFLLYVKTYQEFRVHENLYLKEFEKKKPVKIKYIKNSEALSTSPIF